MFHKASCSSDPMNRFQTCRTNLVRILAQLALMVGAGAASSPFLEASGLFKATSQGLSVSEAIEGWSNSTPRDLFYRSIKRPKVTLGYASPQTDMSSMLCNLSMECDVTPNADSLLKGMKNSGLDHLLHTQSYNDLLQIQTNSIQGTLAFRCNDPFWFGAQHYTCPHGPNSWKSCTALVSGMVFHDAFFWVQTPFMGWSFPKFKESEFSLFFSGNGWASWLKRGALHLRSANLAPEVRASGLENAPSGRQLLVDLFWQCCPYLTLQVCMKSELSSGEDLFMSVIPNPFVKPLVVELFSSAQLRLVLRKSTIQSKNEAIDLQSALTYCLPNVPFASGSTESATN